MHDAFVRFDLDTARPREVVRRAGGDDATLAQDRDAVAHELHLAEQVRVQQHRDAAPLQLLQNVAHGAPPGRIERRGRLVEEEQRRRADERLRDPEALLHALRHRLDARLARVRKPDEREQLDAFRFAAGRAGETLVQLEHLVRARPAGKAEQLREVPERAPRRRRARRGAADLRAAARRPHEAARDLDERGLPRAVRPEQAEELAVTDLELDARERLRAPVPLLERANGERGHARQCTASAP